MIYQAVNNSAYYADNVDRLIVNADKKKLVFFAGCSFAYGVNSNMADNMFGGEYVVCNMGVNGDINGAFQMEIILSCLGEGDILVHSPEQMSAPQLMSSFSHPARPAAVMPPKPSASQGASEGGASCQPYSVKSAEQ